MIADLFFFAFSESGAILPVTKETKENFFMFETRKDAIEAVAARPALKSGEAIPFHLEDYGTDVFGIDCMRERLPQAPSRAMWRTP